MAAKVKPIPDGFHTVTPYLIVDGAKKVIDFMHYALGAKHDHEPTLRPDGTIMHATLKIGDSMVMISDASEHAKAAPVMLYLYVPNVDTAFKRALDAGAKAVQPVTDMFWGDRIAQIADPSGHQWTLATHKEDLTPEEIGRRQKDFLATMGAQQKKKK